MIRSRGSGTATFGMLIELLFERFPSGEVDDQAIGDLELFHKASKQRFDSDADFKERAQRAVVSLQGGKEKYRNSGKHGHKSFKYLKISNTFTYGYFFYFRGESFYNPYIPGTLDLLRQKGLIEESEGAQLIFEGRKIPLIVVKRDGGFNYTSTDLAAALCSVLFVLFR
ncbi:hypothetical protein L1887_02871 [Cichorium endivia]|nr:hypothetical protein L1887_02871 [Cichorium endivia]